ncbi:MAG: glycosyltransferase family 2 protein, partial [Methylacidiphilales bacterium]|nr:glycosyltransferase family 2 protein [Candidatus Methylacidiphilales bacterium]
LQLFLTDLLGLGAAVFVEPHQTITWNEAVHQHHQQLAREEQNHISNTPLVSVIIPVFNTAAYLRTCLDSVLAQSYPALEIICVNDCSTDDSDSILQEYQAQDPRITIVSSAENRGLLFTRVTGFKNATGDYCLCVDSDDKLLSNKIIQTLVNRALITNADIVHFGSRDRYPSGAIRYDQWFSPRAEFEVSFSHAIVNGFVSHNHWNKFVKNTIWNKVLSTKLLDSTNKQSNWEDLNAFLVVIKQAVIYAPVGVLGYERLLRTDSLTSLYSQYATKRTLTDYMYLVEFIQKYIDYFQISQQEFITMYFGESLRYTRNKIIESINNGSIRLPTTHKINYSPQVIYFIDGSKVLKATHNFKLIEFEKINTAVCDLQFLLLKNKPDLCLIHSSANNLDEIVLLLYALQVECWLIIEDNLKTTKVDATKLNLPFSFFPYFSCQLKSEISSERKIRNLITSIFRKENIATSPINFLTICVECVIALPYYGIGLFAAAVSSGPIKTHAKRILKKITQFWKF